MCALALRLLKRFSLIGVAWVAVRFFTARRHGYEAECKSGALHHDSAELSLATRRLRIETRLKRIDQSLVRKQIALDSASQQGWRVVLSPTGAAVLAAIVALFGTAAGKWADYLATQRKAETDVIIKASDVPISLSREAQDTQRARNLLYFLRAGYIHLPESFVEELNNTAKLQPGEMLGAPVFQSAAQDAQPSDGEEFAPMRLKHNLLISDLLPPDAIIPSATLYASISDKRYLDNIINGLLQFLSNNGCLELNQNGTPLQILIIRNNDEKATYADVAVCLSRNSDNKTGATFLPCESKPFGTHLTNPINPDGAARICPGHYYYKIGTSMPRPPGYGYATLREASDVFIERIDSSHVVKTTQKGNFSITFIKAEHARTSGSGCIMLKEDEGNGDFASLMSEVEKAKSAGQRIFPITIIQIDR